MASAASLRLLVASGSLVSVSAVRSTMKEHRVDASGTTAFAHCCCQKLEEGEVCGYSGFAGAFNSAKHEIQAPDGAKYCCKGRSSGCDDKYPNPIREVLKGGPLANPYTCEIYKVPETSTCCCMETGGDTGKTCLRGVKEDGKKTGIFVVDKVYCCKTRDDGCDEEEDRYSKPIGLLTDAYDAKTCAAALPKPTETETVVGLDDEDEASVGETLDDESTVLDEQEGEGTAELTNPGGLEEEGNTKPVVEVIEDVEASTKPVVEDEIEDVEASSPTSSPAVISDSESDEQETVDDTLEDDIPNGEVEDVVPVEEKPTGDFFNGVPMDVTSLFVSEGEMQKEAHVKGMDLLCCCHGSAEISPGVRCTLEDKDNIEGSRFKSSCGKKGDTWHSLLTMQSHSKYESEAWVKKCVVSSNSLEKFPDEVKAAITA
eukprot:TRINITY_DN1967_c0_g1_i8.p1 TRINITY_DN1967_c0_g1~~TRINITY_DN1967_c0_g1_i8.p1  ORF type:complete len:450 (-),score=141.12 TRINITY_DN1967_c0_g1_i8:149-1435(-)